MAGGRLPSSAFLGDLSGALRDRDRRIARRERASRAHRRYALTLAPSAADAPIARHVARFVDMDVPGARTAVSLAGMSLAESTSSGYGYSWERFVDYCEVAGVEALPASPLTVFTYLGWLAEQGTIAASSLQPTLSAINGAHRDVGLEPPAVDSHIITAVRRGMGRAQAATSSRDSRIPLPCVVVESALIEGLLVAWAFRDVSPCRPSRRGRGPPAFCSSPRGSAARSSTPSWVLSLRSFFSMVLGSLFSGRSDSTVHLRTTDFGVDPDFMWIRLTEKGKRHTCVRRVVRLPQSCRPVHGEQSALPQVADLARAWLRVHAEIWDGVQPEWLFQLPGESRPTTRAFAGWFSLGLSELSVEAPPGFAYLPHSVRSGSASAQAAIGVPRHMYTWVGGWVRGSVVVDRDYVDPTVLPSPSAYRLHGWLLSRQYSADAGVVERFVPLVDPLEEGVLDLD